MKFCSLKRLINEKYIDKVKCSYGLPKFKPSRQKKFHIWSCFVIVFPLNVKKKSADWIWIWVRQLHYTLVQISYIVFFRFFFIQIFRISVCFVLFQSFADAWFDWHYRWLNLGRYFQFGDFVHFFSKMGPHWNYLWHSTQASNFSFLNSLKILECDTNRDRLLLATLR